MTVHLRWPHDRFYWAVLEAPPCRGELPPGLRAALEEVVPHEDLHAVCAPVGQGRVLTCAVPRTTLVQLGPDILSLTPQCIPEFATGAPEDLNLLVGGMEPLSIRRARRLRHLVLLTTVLMAAALISVGLARRESRWKALAAGADEARERLIASVLPAGVDLGKELARRRRSSDSAPAAVMDAIVELSKLLTAWPAQTPSKPLSIVVGSAGMQCDVCVEGDAAPFAAAFKPPAGWTLDEPRLNTAGSLTRLNLQLRPVQGDVHD